MKNIDTEQINHIAKIITGKPTCVVVVPHINPDGDAIGSAIGLATILKNYGHVVQVVVPNDFPSFYNWLINEDVPVINYDRKKAAATNTLEQADCIFCLDFNEISRAGKMKQTILDFNKPKILVDHHPNPKNFCDYMVSEPSYSSTAELVYDVAAQLGLSNHITNQAATALFTGIMTDTGSFSHNISDPNTFKVVSELLNYNIDADTIHANVYHNYSADRMKLLGHCLANKMEIFPEYKTAMISITKKELAEFSFTPGDTEGFVNYPLSISGIIFSVLFIEKDDHIKLSLRSKGSFPANAFSEKHFDGGGHLNAAGGESKLSFDDAIELFKSLLPQYKNQLLDS